MSVISINRKATVEGTIENLPSSKSLSNRALVLQALAGNQPVVSNLSSARDTVLMQKLIGSSEQTIDVMDAGTTMRFLTGYFATRGVEKIMTGAPRMKQRPIGLLVDALRKLGAHIDYLEKEGYPPLALKGFGQQLTASIEMPGHVSSQYISSLMMVAPTLPNGLTIVLTGKIGSRPYIEMTAALMRHFGGQCHFDGHTIEVPAGSYKAKPYAVEGDWSGASYWYGFTALAKEASIQVKAVVDESLQGDRAIVTIMDQLGVHTVFNDEGALLSKKAAATSVQWDFAQCPDLAQTVLPVCAAKGIKGTFTGLESLRIKETDRIYALQQELGKLGAHITEPTTGTWVLTPAQGALPAQITVETYHDHRMAMGLAPLATLMNVDIHDPEVVNKSYPTYWKDVASLGFTLTQR